MKIYSDSEIREHIDNFRAWAERIRAGQDSPGFSGDVLVTGINGDGIVGESIDYLDDVIEPQLRFFAAHPLTEYEFGKDPNWRAEWCYRKKGDKEWQDYE